MVDGYIYEADPVKPPPSIVDPTKPQVVITTEGFRPGTETHKRDFLYAMKHGAMGDYICWMIAIEWIARTHNFIDGHLIVPHWFNSLATHILKPYKNWRVYNDEIPDKFKNGYPIKLPEIHPINATMMHLTDLGFLYFASTHPIPEGEGFYPELDLEEIRFPKQLEGKDFVVMTPGSTAKSRTMPADIFNKIVDHILELGMTPVFLGTNKMGNTRRVIGFDKGYDLSRGENFIDKTTVLQAAKIMSKAKAVLGIDNGLLHLAACTSVPIIFGYTIAGPEQRRPKRRNGALYELYPDKKKLPCTFCQHSVRFFLDHNFENCIYKDYQCLRELNAESFNATLDILLENEAKNR